MKHRRGYTLIEVMAVLTMAGCIFGAMVQFAGLCFSGTHRAGWRTENVQRCFDLMHAWRDEIAQVSLENARAAKGRFFADTFRAVADDAGFLRLERGDAVRRVRLPHDAALSYAVERHDGHVYAVLHMRWEDRYALRTETNTVRFVAAGGLP